jgi:hypothetical protein
MPIRKPEARRPPRKANYSERVGRKVTGLKPSGQGSGIAEVDTRKNYAQVPMILGPFYGELGEPEKTGSGKRRWGSNNYSATQFFESTLMFKKPSPTCKGVKK